VTSAVPEFGSTALLSADGVNSIRLASVIDWADTAGTMTSRTTSANSPRRIVAGIRNTMNALCVAGHAAELVHNRGRRL